MYQERLPLLIGLLLFDHILLVLLLENPLLLGLSLFLHAVLEG